VDKLYSPAKRKKVN